MKLEATFERFVGWDTSRSLQAYLQGVEHPTLGSQKEVTTSRVVAISYGEDKHVSRIETLNTVYTLRV